MLSVVLHTPYTVKVVIFTAAYGSDRESEPTIKHWHSPETVNNSHVRRNSATRLYLKNQSDKCSTN